jgi:hypothetical protein
MKKGSFKASGLCTESENFREIILIQFIFREEIQYLGGGEVGLSLPELGQVEGGDLLRLLNLLLVAPDLPLQLVNQALRRKQMAFQASAFGR